MIESVLMGRNGKQSGAEITFQCPETSAHKNGDQHSSCRFNTEKRVAYCPVCQYKANEYQLCMALGVTPPDNGRKGNRSRKKEVVATYDYVDEKGKQLFHVL